MGEEEEAVAGPWKRRGHHDLRAPAEEEGLEECRREAVGGFLPQYWWSLCGSFGSPCLRRGRTSSCEIIIRGARRARRFIQRSVHAGALSWRRGLADVRGVATSRTTPGIF